MDDDCPTLLESLRDRIADLDALSSAAARMLDALPRVADEAVARTVGRLGRLVEHIARDTESLLTTADQSVARVRRPPPT